MRLKGGGIRYAISTTVLHSELLAFIFWLFRDACFDSLLLGSNVWPLLYESSPIVPEAIVQCEGVLQVIILCGPGFRIYPLFRGKSENDFSKIEIFFKKVLVATTPLKRLESDILPSYDYLDVLLRSYLGTY